MEVIALTQDLGLGGEYNDFSCVGMDSVTSKFNKIDLSEICSEYKSQADPNHSVPPLTKYMGGGGGF